MLIQSWPFIAMTKVKVVELKPNVRSIERIQLRNVRCAVVIVMHVSPNQS